MDIIKVYMYAPRMSLADESKYLSKYMCYRELATRRISFHRCYWKKWYHDVEYVYVISGKAIEKCQLSEEVFYRTKISDIRYFFFPETFLLFEKDSWPSIGKFLESYDFGISEVFLEVREVRMDEVHILKIIFSVYSQTSHSVY